MDKESLIELQKIDCNCNDCLFMVRDGEEFKRSLERHYKWQFDYYLTCKRVMIEKAREVLRRFDYSVEKKQRKVRGIIIEIKNMKFQFDKKESMINYGNCSKLEKPVSFIPNVCQLETQQCFKHRRL